MRPAWDKEACRCIGLVFFLSAPFFYLHRSAKSQEALDRAFWLFFQ